MVVFPLGLRREAHQDRLRPSIRFQSEFCPSVPDEVEFNITPASQMLPLFFTLAIGKTAVLVHEVDIDRRKRTAYIFDKGEALFLGKTVLSF